MTQLPGCHRLRVRRERGRSFEDDADQMDGWVVPGAPEGSEPNPHDWLRGTVEDFPPVAGENIDAAFARQGEVLDVISGLAGPYPEGHPFWSLPIGDPGPDSLFEFAVYARGAMTLHELRLAVGDDAFFEILHRWAVDDAGRNVTTADFVQLAEQVSGQELDDLFDAWLFVPERPPLGLGAASVTAAGSGLSATLDGSDVAGSAPVVARVQLQRAALSGSR